MEGKPPKYTNDCIDDRVSVLRERVSIQLSIQGKQLEKERTQN